LKRKYIAHIEFSTGKEKNVTKYCTKSKVKVFEETEQVITWSFICNMIHQLENNVNHQKVLITIQINITITIQICNLGGKSVTSWRKQQKLVHKIGFDMRAISHSIWK
jgi:hypothetical protein